MRNYINLFAVILISFYGCVNNSNQRIPGQPYTEFEGTPQNGVKKIYNAEGKLETEVPYKDSLPNGIQKEYYKTGELFRETPFINGLANGMVKEYNKKGKTYREMPVTNGKANGIVKKYYENGMLFSEAPFIDGQPVAGLKEYDNKGNLISQPKLIFKAKNMTKIDGTYELEISLSDQYIKPLYYQILVFEDKEMPTKLETRNGNGLFKITVPQGSILTRRLTFEARYTTARNNTCIIRDKFDVAIN